jgi:hypothetical protein
MPPSQDGGFEILGKIFRSYVRGIGYFLLLQKDEDGGISSREKRAGKNKRDTVHVIVL